MTPGATEAELPPPRLTVIICTSNRAAKLHAALQALAAADPCAPSRVELVVVDNNSTDDTRQVVERATLPRFDVRYTFEPRQGSSFARNTGILCARGDMIAFTDDDCIVAPDWTDRIIRHFAADEALDVLGGRIELFNPDHAPVTIRTSREFMTIDPTCYHAGFVHSANMAFRRRVVERIGLFDHRFGAGALLKSGEDADFIFRAQRAGCRILYAPDVLVRHDHGRTGRDQVGRLRRGYLFGDGALLTKHILGGDALAARRFYWRLVHIAAARFGRPSAPDGDAYAGPADIIAMLSGAAAYVVRAAWRPSGTKPPAGAARPRS